MAKTLLINGCSYAHQWNPDKWFEGWDIVNLAECGGGNRRAMRTTIEWILENGNPDYVLTPITYFVRYESFFDSDRLDSEYISIYKGFYDSHKYGRIMEAAAAIEHSSVALDRFLTDMVMFDSFLKQRNIPYLMWNMCMPSEYWPAIVGTMKSKMDWLKNNERIVDFNFVGNRYLGENGARNESTIDDGVDITARHYDKNDYYILENYLNDYRKL